MFYLRRFFQTLVPADLPKQPSKILLTLICLTLSVQSAAGQSMGKASLSHLDGIFVNALVSKEAQENGLTPEQIESEAELELRKANIQIYTRQEFFNSEASPVLRIRVGTYKRKNGLFIYNIGTEVSQTVVTAGGSQTSGVTYDIAEHVGTVGANNLREMTDAIQDDVRTFANDWLSVHE